MADQNLAKGRIDNFNQSLTRMANKGTYRNCGRHLVAAGLRINEASEKSKVSEASIRRIISGKSVLETTISKLINCLNDHHFKKEDQPLSLSAEFVPDPA